MWSQNLPPSPLTHNSTKNSQFLFLWSVQSFHELCFNLLKLITSRDFTEEVDALSLIGETIQSFLQKRWKEQKKGAKCQIRPLVWHNLNAETEGCSSGALCTLLRSSSPPVKMMPKSIFDCRNMLTPRSCRFCDIVSFEMFQFASLHYRYGYQFQLAKKYCPINNILHTLHYLLVRIWNLLPIDAANAPTPSLSRVSLNSTHYRTSSYSSLFLRS